MLQSLSPNGLLAWQCDGGEEDEFCEALCTCDISEVTYRNRNSRSRGAMIALPPCEICGAAKSLKADYTLKELAKIIQTVVDDLGNTRGYVMPLRYVRNLRLHHLLYEQGEAGHPPILPMPAQGYLDHPGVAAIGDVDVAYSLWFSFALMREQAQLASASNAFFFDLVPLPLALPASKESS